MVRPWRRRSPMGEMELLAEYVARTYPQDLVMMRVRLGTVTTEVDLSGLPERSRGIVQVMARWADAVIVRPHELVVLEAGMRSDTGDVSKLQIYGSLVPLTAELRPYLDRPTVLELVVAIEDPVVTAWAEAAGIRVRLYKPAWLAEWSAKRNRRESRAPHHGGLLP